MKRLMLILLLWSTPEYAPAATLDAHLDQWAGADGAALIPLIEALAADDAAAPVDRRMALLQALLQGDLLHDAKGRVLLKRGEGFQLALTGAQLETSPTQASTWMVNNAVRRSLRQALSVLGLKATDPQIFRESLDQLEDPLPEATVKLLEQRWEQETNADIREDIRHKLATTDLNSGDAVREKRALQGLAASDKRETLNQLQDFLRDHPDTSLRDEVESMIQRMQWHFIGWDALGHTLYGLSLSSILLLVSLGLAITFGLMKIINMAHGEMLMIGAYASYMVQNPLLSIPLAFLVTALIGLILERTIIRHLYGRPLETLLTTWGISLILIQSVRLLFGAQNVEVAVPGWLSGGITLTEGLVVPFNRLFAIGVSLAVVTSVWLFFRFTRWGLLIRAVQQNRAMASCLRISTEKVDALTFAMGSGIAGIGGAILSQITNVGPEMGQSYIIDSFLVVVLGGVGHIGGAILGALALGLSSKYLEAVTGAVMAKIIVMALIILFIQKRPEGLLAHKGRAHVIDA